MREQGWEHKNQLEEQHTIELEMLLEKHAEKLQQQKNREKY